jgi:hypothetical protein
MPVVDRSPRTRAVLGVSLIWAAVILASAVQLHGTEAFAAIATTLAVGAIATIVVVGSTVPGDGGE